MRLSIALSGGGARCAAQLGYLDALWHDIDPIAFAGSSGGAIVAALLAQGKSPKEALEIVLSVNFSKIKLDLRRALFSALPMEEELHRIGLDRFENLSKPLFVTVTDHTTLQPHYLHQGDLARALLASTALIPLFAPIHIGGKLYIDGGFSDNLPLAPLPSDTFTLAINVNPTTLPYPNTLFGNFKRAAYTLLNSHIRLLRTKANFYTEIEECANYGILERKKLQEIFRLGYQAAQKDRKRWEAIWSKNSSTRS